MCFSYRIGRQKLRRKKNSFFIIFYRLCCFEEIQLELHTWMIFMTSNTQIWISESVQVSFLIINRGEFHFLVRSTLRVVFLISKVTQQVEIVVTQIYRNSSFSLCQQKWWRNSFLREHKAPADFFKVLYFNYLCICFSLLQLSIIHVPIRLFTQL